ncbi:MAG: UvrD-helicase domain-containing protein [Saprospiraceae bacterium]|nr:UvrD-helicase domain-containing protein [Saprospiraceae bacterium]
MKKANIKIISAGAGSGKTYRLTQEMVALLRGGTRASGIIATTFTSKAAAELAERVRTKLLEEGLTAQANDLSNALIGTVHGLGVKLLKRFAFEAGVSPQVDIMAEEDSQIFFNRSLSQIMTQPRVERINGLADKLGLTKKNEAFDWRRVVQQLVDTARANAFDRDILEQSKVLSFRTFQTFLGEKINYPGDYNAELSELLNETINNISAVGDETKITNEGIGELKTLRNDLQQRSFLFWHQWVKITKIKVSAKCRDLLEPLTDFAKKHAQLADFQSDVENYIASIFDVVIDALGEFERFKKQRGLIDYTDMEVLVRGLLANPSVLEVLNDELDLLMVDEFQDTSPIQLDIFLKLSLIAKHSIWVGDPKQSIYGFRGAEPRLMQAILTHVGIKDEDILKDSWRSRPDIVAATNAIFCRAFADLPTEQVALNAKREDKPEQTEALIHWHFSYDNGGDTRKKQPGSLAEAALLNPSKFFWRVKRIFYLKAKKIRAKRERAILPYFAAPTTTVKPSPMPFIARA